MVTRSGLVAKKGSFPAQNDVEKGSRRQKMKFLGSKWRREKGSSPKTRLSDLKTATRTRLVAKKWGFSAQNGDEIRSRRQKHDFLTPKRRREQVSPAKIRLPQLKTTTRTGLAGKNPTSPP
ncbi:hypothetical protein P9386_00505 [Caldifermentibacillus hisashii]|uniref:hypothetical protein n=1 Tax=Caldifermentibacillus hisashii TaxID=996558 RepID=UPI002E1A5032|nr:hypothetical protein [Caldifermentibacillus hisashii]